jgi:hypothetical protein
MLSVQEHNGVKFQQLTKIIDSFNAKLARILQKKNYLKNTFW